MTQRKTWRCFFCDEVFTTPGAAADHFGSMFGSEPGCLVDFKVQVEAGGTPERGRGLLMALRKAEERIEQLQQQVLEGDYALEALEAQRSDFKRRWPDHGGNPVMAYDYLEGLLLVEREKVKELERQIREYTT